MSTRDFEGEIILKGEVHTSSSDLSEEARLLEEKDIEGLVLECSKTSEYEINFLNYWFIYIFKLFLKGTSITKKLPFGYKSKNPISKIADRKDIDIKCTREKNSDIFENLNLPVKILFNIFFYIYLLYIVFLVTTNDFLNISTVLWALLIPLLFILGVRKSEEYDLLSKKSREKIMADKATEFIDEGKTKIMIIVGQGHFQKLKNKLEREGNQVQGFPSKLYFFYVSTKIVIFLIFVILVFLLFV
ncbi:hypothetical protein AMET1_1205 [Methanonatronarchaeum thermophilum]|uniref:Uncharacterized protein n=1 Tax=Methanonatronarchaeum thermophilum TaxID=1927129 RepID=A0A1Y3GDL5_9EURY|nr:hypothetical protein [Methanonatronarchaeum thermophilum]OUJ18294.1 hypothetical protein AMET1_1205 [Methanonatronarchaeum thermophilum]